MQSKYTRDPSILIHWVYLGTNLSKPSQSRLRRRAGNLEVCRSIRSSPFFLFVFAHLLIRDETGSNIANEKHTTSELKPLSDYNRGSENGEFDQKDSTVEPAFAGRTTDISGQVDKGRYMFLLVDAIPDMNTVCTIKSNRRR
jgi:hypothetical protein